VKPLTLRWPFLAPRNHWRHFLLCLPLLLGFWAVWLNALGYPAFTEDEAFVTKMAERPVRDILQQLNSTEPHPPAYYLFMHVWRVLIGGRQEFLIRFPSLLLGMVLISLVYRLGLELGLNRRGAFMASVLIGLNPQITVHLREARMYGPMLVTLAVAALVTVRFDRLPRRAALGLAAAVSLLALLTHYFNLTFILALAVWGALSFKGETRRQWIIAQAIALGALALWLPFMGRGFFNSTNLSTGKTWSFLLPPWETLARLAMAGAFGYRDYLWNNLAWLGGLVLAGGWLAGSLLARGTRRWFLLIMVAMPVGVYALVCWIKPVYHPKYALPWLIFASLAIAWLAQRVPWRGGSVWAALLVLMVFPWWRTIARPYSPVLALTRNEWLPPSARELAQALLALARPTDVFSLSTPDWSNCYYTDYHFEQRLGCALLPAFPAQTEAELTSQVDTLLEAHTVLWHLDYYNPAWDPQHNFDTVMTRQALFLGTEDLAGRSLGLFTSPKTVVQQQQPVQARFGSVAELEGVWFAQGQTLHTVLVWRALADHPAVEAKVFVQLVDGDGQVVAQDDSVPVAWTRPLSTWQTGEQLLDVHGLALPAGSTGGVLRIGLYDPATLARLPAYDQSGAPLPDAAASSPITLIVPKPLH
jgi:hypothetical protein